MKKSLKNTPRFTAALLALCFTLNVADAMVGEEAYIAFERDSRGAALVADGAAAPLWLDANDHSGVLRAAGDVQADIERVTGVRPALSSGDRPAGKVIVVAGVVGKSRALDALHRRGKIDLSGVRGKWESFLLEVIERPYDDVERAIVIAGSDKRGAIYGLYDLSSQIGVSPWRWWADVPVARREALYVKSGRRLVGEPAVKYRGIFLNDEAPALQGWAEEKFGGLNHEFYAHVFELILRLRGNYLWPAMWGNAFIDDDPRNAPLADEYGVVIGTSHHEPLMRAHDEWRRYGKGPWDYSRNAAELRQFWRGGVQRVRDFEKIISVGMRGDGDEAMSEETNVALLETIVADQREVLRTTLGREPAQIPQLWALYKEVQDYYERGMRVPDDVTLLWSDDNWGNLRRLPLPAERSRAGGAGVYYHFDYVGGPRNYKWLNTVPLTKIQEQMHLAWRYGATRIWIVNVGDLKPMEFPIEFFLTMAWDPARWPYEKLREYSRAWTAREFGAAHAEDAAALIEGYTKLNSLRKPEMLAPDTYSLVNYDEAERMLWQWRTLSKHARALHARLPADMRDAFFQLVAYPVVASAAVQEMYTAVGRNRLYARQGRTDAERQAQNARNWFRVDGELAAEYHDLRGGKWRHMMDQINIGYTTWQQPDMEVMPAVHEVRARPGASPAMAIEGSETAWPSYRAERAVLPPVDDVSRRARWIELFNRGEAPYTYEASADQSWVVIDNRSGAVKETARLQLSVNWREAPAGAANATISIETSAGETLKAVLPVRKFAATVRGFRGFVESDGYVAMEAPHFTRTVNDGATGWRELPDFGRTLGGMAVFPVDAAARDPAGKTPRLEYDFYLQSAGELQIELHCAPSLDFQSGAGLRVAVSVDDARPAILRLDTYNEEHWPRAVAEGIRRIASRHAVAAPGKHTLKVWMITPGVVIERIVIDAGGVRPSYLGPPESPRVGS